MNWWKRAFTCDVRWFWDIFDLPTCTCPIQILHHISLFSKIRCSLTYRVPSYLKIWRHLWMLPKIEILPINTVTFFEEIRSSVSPPISDWILIARRFKTEYPIIPWECRPLSDCWPARFDMQYCVLTSFSVQSRFSWRQLTPSTCVALARVGERALAQPERTNSLE